MSCRIDPNISANISGDTDTPHRTFCAAHPDHTQIGGDHYRILDIQPWHAMADWMSDSEFQGFLRGNAIKYLARAGKKGNFREDLEKARHYLDKLIQLYNDET